jgi:hypothetical protein
MKRLLILISLELFAGNPSVAQLPVVADPHWSIDEDAEFVTITYDLKGSPGATYEVSVTLLSKDGTGIRESPDGDLLLGRAGKRVEPGHRRKIIWNFARDPISKIPGERWAFEIEAKGNHGKSTAESNIGSFTPPALHISTAVLTGPSGSGLLNAEESGELTCIVTNTGKGIARGVTVSLTPQSDAAGVEYPSSMLAGDIQAADSSPVRFSLSASEAVASKEIQFRLDASDENLQSMDSSRVMIRTVNFLSPALVVKDAWIRGPGDSLDKRLEPGSLVHAGDSLMVTLRVENQGPGDADSTYLNVNIEDENNHVFYASKSRPMTIQYISMATGTFVSSAKSLPAGKHDVVFFRLFVDKDCPIDTVVFETQITERHRALWVAKRFALRVRRTLASVLSSIDERRVAGQTDSAITLCTHALQENPDSLILYVRLGSLYKEKGEIGPCLESYQEAARKGSEEAKDWLESNTKSSPIRSVMYHGPDTNPFAGAPRPVSVGFSRLVTNKGEDILKEIYELAKSSPAARDGFNMYPSSTLEKLVPNFETLNPTVLRSLVSSEVGFVVHGEMIDDARGTFNLMITKTADGKRVFSHRYSRSNTSTAVKDAAKLFSNLKVPEYKDETSVQLREEP